MFRSVAAAIAASLLFAAPISAQAPAAPPSAPAPAAWQTHDYADLGFSAAFPGDPKRVDTTTDLGKDEKTGEDQGPMAMTIFVAGSPQRAYLVLRADFSKSKLDADALQKQMDAAKDKFTGTVDDPKAGKITFTGQPGHEMIVDKDGQAVRMRFYISGKFMFMVMVASKGGPADAVKDADADRFMNSFKLLS